MFAFAFEERLFAFRLPNPAFAPLFAFADKRAPAATTLLCFYFFNPTPFSLLRSPSFAVRQKRHKRNPRVAFAVEER